MRFGFFPAKYEMKKKMTIMIYTKTGGNSA